MNVSIVIPVYNEAESLPILHDQIRSAILSTEALLDLKNRLPLGSIGQFGSSFGYLTDIDKALNEILDPQNLIGGLLGIKGDLAPDGLGLVNNSTFNFFCDFNLSQYFNIHKILGDFIN